MEDPYSKVDVFLIMYSFISTKKYFMEFFIYKYFLRKLFFKYVQEYLMIKYEENVK